MIFLAVAGPTPGNASRSFSEAVLRSTLAEGLVEGAERRGSAGGRGDALAAARTVTIELILSIVALETPAFVRSAVDVYGRPAIIFLAVAGPTPGRASSSCSVALLRSTGALLVFAAAAGFGARAARPCAKAPGAMNT